MIYKKKRNTTSVEHIEIPVLENKAARMIEKCGSVLSVHTHCGVASTSSNG